VEIFVAFSEKLNCMYVKTEKQISYFDSFDVENFSAAVKNGKDL
jgi:hypothetical protein